MGFHWKLFFSLEKYKSLENNIIPYYNMFQNSYQNGTFFELFDPKQPQDKTKNLYKLQNVQATHKVFDKSLKTFIYEFTNANSKISFPKEDKKELYLIQQYLNLQIEFGDGDWHIELTVNDLTRTKRRIILSPAVHKIEKKPFFVKFPCPPIRHGVWVNLCIDLYSFIDGFKGQTYRSLDLIQIVGNLKLRRIYTTQHEVSNSELENEIVFLPKNFFFSSQIENERYLIRFEDVHGQENPDHVQMSTKSASNIASSKAIKREMGSKKQIKEVKEQKSKTGKQIGKQKEKPTVAPEPNSFKDIEINIEKPKKDQRKFLANTNGLQALKIKKQVSKNEEGNQDTSKSIITPLSTGKALKKRREPLSKTQNQKEKTSSIENKGNLNPKGKSPQKNKAKQAQKLNPWRSSAIKKSQTGRHELQKQEDERKIESAQATLFKTRNNLAGKESELKGKHFDRNSDHSRESDYFQLSQKFSTVTQTRFFKNELASKNWQQEATKEAHDQIEENIEIETNSHYSNSNPNSNVKNKENLCIELYQKPIEESINDSLDEMASKKRNSNGKAKLSQNESYFNSSSRMGFGQKMMNKYMKQLQRPYSPPLGQREHTQQHQPIVKQFQNEKGVQLMYDPVLNCYYDHKTHTYYELKN